jgi:hypothetical protein
LVHLYNNPVKRECQENSEVFFGENWELRVEKERGLLCNITKAHISSLTGRSVKMYEKPNKNRGK